MSVQDTAPLRRAIERGDFEAAKNRGADFLDCGDLVQPERRARTVCWVLSLHP